MHLQTDAIDVYGNVSPQVFLLSGVDSRVAASGPVDMTKQAVVHIDTNE